MKVWNATEEQIRAAIDAVGLKVYGEWDSQWGGPGIVQDGRALRFRLGIDTTQARNAEGFLPYQRCRTTRNPDWWTLAETGRDGRPRKIAAVCWHGHRDMMRALFALAPEARIKTTLADYRGASDFERQYGDTYGNGNGWNLSYGQACGCAPAVREEWEAAA